MPAPLTRTFSTTNGTQVVLADGTNTPIAANPQSVNHLPARILVIPVAGALIWLDAAGTSNTITFATVAAGNPSVPFYLPGTAKSFEAGSATGHQISVSWNSAP
jgi:hypothetical protein